MFCIFAYLTRDGLKSALIAVAKMVSTVAYGSANLFFARVMILFTGIIWLTYNFIIKSYAGVLNEAMTIVSIIIGIIQINIPALKMKGRENHEIYCRKRNCNCRTSRQSRKIYRKRPRIGTKMAEEFRMKKHVCKKKRLTDICQTLLLSFYFQLNVTRP